MYNLINKQTGEILTTMPEPIDCWQVRDGIAEWQEYQPPALTKEELLTQLDTEYKPQFDELARAISVALLGDDQVLVNSIKTDYQALKDEYQQKREGILNG